MDEDERLKKELEIHLAEYTKVADEISVFGQRIERIRGIYLAAAFGIVAFVLRPEAGPAVNYLDRIERDRFLVGVTLLIPILNSILLIHVASFMHFIYAGAKYTTFYLGERMSEILGRQVLFWDRWNSVIGDKEAWVTSRSLVGLSNYVLANLVSLAILYRFAMAGRFEKGGMPFALYVAACWMVALCFVVAGVNYWMGRHFNMAEVTLQRTHMTRWYLLSVPFGIGLYVVFRIVGYRP